MRPTVATQLSEFYRRRGEEEDLLLKGIRWGAGWRPRRRPGTHGDL